MNNNENVTAGTIGSSECYASSRPWTWKDKLRCRLFPWNHCDLPEAPATHKDVLICRVISELSLRDRLRVLVTGRIRLESRTVTEHVIGDHKTKSAFMALPPRWWDREA